jgi:hypothetical protein
MKPRIYRSFLTMLGAFASASIYVVFFAYIVSDDYREPMVRAVFIVSCALIIIHCIVAFLTAKAISHCIFGVIACLVILVLSFVVHATIREACLASSLALIVAFGSLLPFLSIFRIMKTEPNLRV